MTPPSLNHASEPEFSPALRGTARVLAAICGVAAGVAMFVVGGLFAVLNSCSGYAADADVCGGLVDTLDLLCVLGGAGAAFTGGVVTAATGQARWIGGGMAITIVLVFLLTILLDMQVPALT